MKNIISLSLAFAMALACSAFAVPAGEILLNDNLESYNVGTFPGGSWRITQATGGMGVVEDGGSKVFKITKPSGAEKSANGATVYLSKQAKGKVTTEFRIKNENAKTFLASPYFVDSTGKAFVTLSLDKTGLFSAHIDGGWKTYGSFTPGKWYQYKVILDFDSQKFDFYIDGEQKVAGANFRNEANELAGLYFYVQEAGASASVDDIKVTATKTGSAVTMPASNGTPTTPDSTGTTLTAASAPTTPIVVSGGINLADENMESYNIGAFPGGNWRVTKAAEGIMAVADVGGNKALQLTRPSNAEKEDHGATLYLSSLASGKVSVEYKVRSSNTKTFTGAAYFVDAKLQTFQSFSLDRTGKISAYFNGKWNGFDSFIANQWYQFKVILDFDSQKFDCYVNGNQIVNQATFRRNATELAGLYFYVQDADSNSYIDDIKVVATKAGGAVNMPDSEPLFGMGIAITEPVRNVSDDHVTVDVGGAYVAYNIKRGIPIDILDLPDGKTKILNFDADAVKAMAASQTRVRVTSPNFQAVIPSGAFKGIDGSMTVEISNGYMGDVNVGNKYKYQNLGYEIKAYTPTKQIAELGEPIIIKNSYVVDKSLNRNLAVLRMTDRGSFVAAEGKNDVVMSGIRLQTAKTGKFVVVSSDYNFNDVSPDRWSAEYVKVLAARAITLGTSPTEFSPEDNVTRAQFVVFLSRAFDLPSAEYNNDFSDVQEGEWYTEAIAAALKAGIIDKNIYGNRFEPNKDESREEMAVMVMKAYLYMSEERRIQDLAKFYDGNFKDINRASEWAQDYIKGGYVMKVISGVSSDTIAPKDSMTREQAAKAIVVTLENLMLLDKNDGIEKMNLIDVLCAPTMYKAYYQYPGLNYPNAAPSGAYGAVNIAFDKGERKDWFIEEQRAVGDDLRNEVLRQVYLGKAGEDDSILAGAWKVFKWGFDHQGSDGGYPGVSDAYHSTYFFAEAVGRTLLMYQLSGSDRYKLYINEYLPKYKKTIEWLLNEKNYNAYVKTGAYNTYGHRNFYSANPLAYYARLVGGDALADKMANKLYEHGVFIQRKNGLLPEKGGFDAGYQAVAIEHAVQGFAVASDVIVKSDLRELAAKGASCNMIRLDDKGNIDLSDSTRNAGQETKRDGTPKSINERSQYNMLSKVYAVTGRPDIGVAIKHMALRQGYMTQAFLEYFDNLEEYNMEFDRPILAQSAASGANSDNMSQLKITSATLSDTGNASQVANLYDGNASTNLSIKNMPQYVVFDLGSIRDVGKVQVSFEQNENKRYYYSIIVSEDGANWTYASESNISTLTEWNESSFTPVRARYVKLWIGQARPFVSANKNVSINEVRIIGK